MSVFRNARIFHYLCYPLNAIKFHTMNKKIIFSLFILFPSLVFAQPPFRRTDTVQVVQNSITIKNPWTGGLNSCQFSAIDLNFDNIKDLFIFDRTGNKITTFINNGTPNTVDYTYAPQYEKKFPANLHDWVLLVDYNGDGKEDIFTYSIAGFAVYKNISSSGNLLFTQVTAQEQTIYFINNPANLYVSSVDIPAITDVDNDGDKDVVTFSISGNQVEYHKNQSMELYGNADSLDFKQVAGCFGEYQEDASGCGITLNACTGGANNDQQRAIQPLPTPLHAGSCLLCIDIDGDRDKDLVTGDIGCCTATMLTNGGDSSFATMIAYDPNFPSNTTSVNQYLFPCPFYVDVNNDGKRDLLFSPNISVTVEDITSILYYLNTGTDNAPVVTYVQNDFLQEEMIDVGSGASPVFFDYDADGLTDLLIANFRAQYSPSVNCLPGASSSSVFVYKNIGTPAAPKYQLVNTDYHSLSSVLFPERAFYLTFGDLDNDGDQDMISGDENGRLHQFTNTAGAGNPAVFSQVTPFYMLDDQSLQIDVGNFSTPQLFDIDRDGLLDLLIGEREGNLNYYRNVGTLSSPSFTFISSAFGTVDISPPSSAFTGYSTPLMFNDSGTYEMFVGSEQGIIYHFNNIDNNLTGTFTLVDSLLWKPTDVWEGIRIALAMQDVTNDGLFDMVVGNFGGGAQFFIGDLTVGNAEEQVSASFAVYPNPAQNTITIKTGNIRSENMQLKIYNVIGEGVMNPQLSNSPVQQVDISVLSDGVYICVLIADGKQMQAKIVVQR